jgi:hypothetical protein
MPSRLARMAHSLSAIVTASSGSTASAMRASSAIRDSPGGRCLSGGAGIEGQRSPLHAQKYEAYDDGNHDGDGEQSSLPLELPLIIAAL